MFLVLIASSTEIFCSEVFLRVCLFSLLFFQWRNDRFLSSLPHWKKHGFCSRLLFQHMSQVCGKTSCFTWYHFFWFILLMRCAIWYHLYNFRNMKNTHGGVLSKVTGSRKLILLHGCYLCVFYIVQTVPNRAKDIIYSVP